MIKEYWNINLKEMIETQVHHGHDIKSWNPKMAPYIATTCKGIHITNLVLTAHFLSKACDYLFDVANEGKHILIISTTKDKKKVNLVASAARGARCHYITKKWLDGTLTNWFTTISQIRRFKQLKERQMINEFNDLSKKEAAGLRRELFYLEAHLSGIEYMSKLPDVVIIINQKEEYKALRECIILGIRTICLVNTNCDPDLAYISIPANDECILSIKCILKKLVVAISKGHFSYIKNK